VGTRHVNAGHASYVVAVARHGPPGAPTAGTGTWRQAARPGRGPERRLERVGAFARVSADRKGVWN